MSYLLSGRALPGSVRLPDVCVLCPRLLPCSTSSTTFLHLLCIKLRSLFKNKMCPFWIDGGLREMESIAHMLQVSSGGPDRAQHGHPPPRPSHTAPHVHKTLQAFGSCSPVAPRGHLMMQRSLHPTSPPYETPPTSLLGPGPCPHRNAGESHSKRLMKLPDVAVTFSALVQIISAHFCHHLKMKAFNNLSALLS